MFILKRLLDYENLEEVRRSYFNYSGTEGFTMPDYRNLELYVEKQLSGKIGRMISSRMAA